VDKFILKGTDKMNTETGEIKEFESEEMMKKFFGDGQWIALEKLPEPNCKHCYGRGYSGYNTTERKYLPCRCTKLKVNSPTDEAKTTHKRYCWKCRWHQDRGGFGDEANIKEECNAIIGKHDSYATDGTIDRLKEHPSVLNANNDCAYYNWNWFGWRGY
jgi:hypothetical protein